MLDPPHCLHVFLRRLCSQMVDSPALFAVDSFTVVLAYARCNALLAVQLGTVVRP